MKRAFICLCMGFFVFLAGCSQENENNNPITITLWHYYTGDSLAFIEESAKEFNNTVGYEKGIIVEAISQGSIANLEDKLMDSVKNAVGADTMPDIFSAYADTAFELSKYNAMADLNQYFSTEELNTYMDVFIQEGYIDNSGNLYILPIVRSTEVLYMNKTDWDIFSGETGASLDGLRTWEGIYECGELYYDWLAEKEGTPLFSKAFTGIDSTANYIIMGNRQLGTEILSAENDGTVILNEENLKKIWNIYYNGIMQGYLGAYGKFRSDDVQTGDLISYVGSTSSASFFPTQITADTGEYSIEHIILPYPVFEGGSDIVLRQGAGMCIAKSDEAKEQAAAEFLKWFTDKERNMEFAMQTGYMPVKKEVYEGNELIEKIGMLRSGNTKDTIIADTYEIAMYQIKEDRTYGFKPFEKSYNVRKILENTLNDIVELDYEKARALIIEGYLKGDLLEELESDEQFNQWLMMLQNECNALEVQLIIQ